MKKALSLILIVTLLLVGCGQSKVIDGKEYKTVGLIDMNSTSPNVDNDFDKEIAYEVCWGNVIWAVLLIETVVAPVYFFGFSMYNPVDKLPATQN